MREIIQLECSECKRKNYSTKVDKKQMTGRLERNKYCSSCKKHTKHKQGK